MTFSGSSSLISMAGTLMPKLCLGFCILLGSKLLGYVQGNWQMSTVGGKDWLLHDEALPFPNTLSEGHQGQGPGHFFKYRRNYLVIYKT